MKNIIILSLSAMLLFAFRSEEQKQQQANIVASMGSMCDEINRHAQAGWTYVRYDKPGHNDNDYIILIFEK